MVYISARNIHYRNKREIFYPAEVGQKMYTLYSCMGVFSPFLVIFVWGEGEWVIGKRIEYVLTKNVRFFFLSRYDTVGIGGLPFLTCNKKNPGI